MIPNWWPATICNPAIVPENIMARSHAVGEFPVKFYGSHDYFWLHRGRVFLFHEGDKGNRYYNKSHLMRVFSKAISEATTAFQEWRTERESKHAEASKKQNQKPNFKPLKVIKPYGSVSMPQVKLTTCDCLPNQEHPCGEDSSCMNRTMYIECNSSVCPAGEKCENQRFTKREYPKLAPLRTEDKGWGLSCCEMIKKGQFVIEYVGELIDEEECKKRLRKMQIENDTKYYFLTVEKDRIIDAGPKGNDARFMNHSCQPNTITQKWTVNGAVRIGLFAIDDIPAGNYTELTFNYNLRCIGDKKIKCECGAPNCSNYIGVRPKVCYCYLLILVNCYLLVYVLTHMQRAVFESVLKGRCQSIIYQGLYVS
ncbi:Histone-lysine N-methyltransferase NSD2 [Nymphon striatum]|nr:Histone-lysine N-methyltransferase NSD2 [Nymphon striatum]